MQIIDTITAWLTPARRRSLYAAATAVGLLLVAAGIVDAETSTTYVAAGIGVLEAFCLVLASLKARSGLRRAAYALGAAVLVLLKLLGVVNDGQESHILELVGHGLAVAALVLAVVKTSPETPTGEPVDEYDARHGIRPVA